jgi:hypothetical protein
VSHRFWDVVFSFSLNFSNLLISSLTFSMTTNHRAKCCSVSRFLSVFYYFLCCWFLLLLHCCQTVCRVLFQFSYVC